MRNTVWVLVVAAACAVLCSTLLFSVMEVKGNSMEPTLYQGEILVAVRKTELHQGDVAAFYYNNRVLLKRVIAEAGDEVVVREDGTVNVNGADIEEPYLTEKSFGNCDVSFPLQVPDGRIFILGDNREKSIDSRSSAIGCISEKSVIGKVVLRIWPLNRIGAV
jgi:signal peptidase I